jgi:uncharacterized protein YceH (UPF0502 family)
VQADLAARFPLEVFNRVGDVNSSSVNARFDQALVQKLARRPNKRSTREIFFIAGLLSDHHHFGVRTFF